MESSNGIVIKRPLGIVAGLTGALAIFGFILGSRASILWIPKILSVSMPICSEDSLFKEFDSKFDQSENQIRPESYLVDMP